MIAVVCGHDGRIALIHRKYRIEVSNPELFEMVLEMAAVHVCPVGEGMAAEQWVQRHTVRRFRFGLHEAVEGSEESFALIFEVFGLGGEFAGGFNLTFGPGGEDVKCDDPRDVSRDKSAAVFYGHFFERHLEDGAQVSHHTGGVHGAPLAWVIGRQSADALFEARQAFCGQSVEGQFRVPPGKFVVNNGRL